MKPVRLLLASFFLLLGLSFSVQAAPPTGTWITPDDFKAGTWEEILSGGGEGRPGNEITATSGPYYTFQGALLSEVKEIKPPQCSGPAGTVVSAEYETKYLGGTLELVTNVLPAPTVPPATPDPKAPWYISNDAAPYIIDLGETTVKTCKFADGQMSFILNSSGIFQNPVYPKYIAEISAKYHGTPTPNDVSPPSISGDLDFAQITITGIVAVDIKPGSCPNPINTKSRGVLPAAILGGPGFNLSKIDKNSIFLTNGDFEGTELVKVYPLRLSIEEDVATPYSFDPFSPRADRLDCSPATFDGHRDLTLKFDTQELVSAFGLATEPDRSTQEWFLMFKLTDGKTELVGSDVVWILNKARNGNHGNHYGRIRHKGY